ncbi:ankyrin repeat domain-containing protein [Gloeobacter morelensis]|uniref:Ankyrin repeat domain-containing protein n=1 Tax=Gloeobacter morelensis MG652769 TaxID=2781736 RepID=A0ABY3PHM8_9CYAN|nr:ankyrin repeat domain-containing protein [Gloeobacter morelensis]UFP93152.1 ankyrin repeat domain-containing protein [Gloeobacter morelensis MG652769]
MDNQQLLQAIRTADSEQIRQLLAQGVSPNGEPEPLLLWLRPRTLPLVEAIRSRNATIVRLLLEAGANPNAADRQGVLPLKVAVYLSDEGIVRLLLVHGADPEKRGGDEIANALQQAAYEGNIPMVRLLLEHGADPAAVTSQDKTVLARLRGPVLQLLIDAGAQVPPEILAMLREGSALP